jgi:isopenicillin-N epimerase
MRNRFGRSMRRLWNLLPEGTFLNHGSFGACPKSVLAEQARIRAAMESQPDVFFRERVMPAGKMTPLRAAARRLGRFVNASAGDVAFVENATGAVQAVLRSVELARGDEILITDHTYNAVRLMVEARCAETGAVARVVRLPLPADPDDIVARFDAAASAATRLAIIDHITSPTALVMPIAAVIALLRRRGARVLVDGAHAVGQVPLDLAKLAPDWYVSNAHKWLYAPRGCAFLYASSEAAAITRPNVVSHYVEMGFPHSFDWTGTRDCTAWLAVPAAIAFHGTLDAKAMRTHHGRILEAATTALGSLGARPVGPIAMCAAMRAFVLPQRRAATREDGLALMQDLWRQHRVQAMATTFGEALLLRVSSQAYVGESDVRRLAHALSRGGWAGR